MNTTKQSLSESAKVGLFWLSKDHKTVEEKIEGENGFDIDDVRSLKIIQPIGGHYWFDQNKDIPRGRIELVRGELRVYLGEDFPKELYDVVLEQLIAKFQLGDFRDIIKPVYHYHWNIKNRGK